jgi:hypothetical protein
VGVLVGGTLDGVRFGVLVGGTAVFPGAAGSVAVAGGTTGLNGVRTGAEPLVLVGGAVVLDGCAEGVSATALVKVAVAVLVALGAPAAADSVGVGDGVADGSVVGVSGSAPAGSTAAGTMVDALPFSTSLSAASAACGLSGAKGGTASRSQGL